jgi:NAD(P)-dependent dehydrogenase (short-subunit alcohol dehydrogenase family)
MKTCIITGANSGIGRSAAFQLAEKGFSVVLACRNMEQAEKTRAQIVEKTGNPHIQAMRVDLSLMAEVKRFIREFTDTHNSLDVLINNAADFDLSRKAPKLTAEGNEAQFATNFLAPFALTKGLLPLLEASGDGRILNISSQGLVLYPNLRFDFDNIRGQKGYSPAKTYYQTKLALLTYSLLLREKLKGKPVSVYCVRVANVKVDLERYPGISSLQKAMYRIKSKFAISPEDMAKVYTELAAGERREGFYYDEKLREVRANRHAYDAEAQRKLWELAECLM